MNRASYWQDLYLGEKRRAEQAEQDAKELKECCNNIERRAEQAEAELKSAMVARRADEESLRETGRYFQRQRDEALGRERELREALVLILESDSAGHSRRLAAKALHTTSEEPEPGTLSKEATAATTLSTPSEGEK